MRGRYRLWCTTACATFIALSGSVGSATVPSRLRPAAVTGLQCPSRTLCVGIGVTGANLVTTRAPHSGHGNWVAETIDEGRPLRLLTCASVRWCIAVDQQNRVLVSTDLRRGAASWQLAPHGPGRHLGNVGELSCPSPRLCVGVAGHYVITSVRPWHGGTAWRQALVNAHAWEQSVDCPTTTRCVAVSDDRQVLTTTDPIGRRAWITTRLKRGARPTRLQSVSCASATQCVVAAGDDHVFSTSNANAAHPVWHDARLGPSDVGSVRLSLTVSCTSADVCAAAGNNGLIWASSVPGLSGQRTWKRVAVDHGIATREYAPASIACAPAGLCVAVEPDGHVLSANAILRPGAWRQQTIAEPPPTT